jgi:EmrB/QacA subfamily drug resistance transporter
MTRSDSSNRASQDGSLAETTIPRPMALVVLLMGAFLPPLDYFIVNLALPAIREGVQATSAQIQLIVSAYASAYAVFLITGGRLGDLFGRKRMFLTGLTGFTASSALCGFATSGSLLVAGRILQGITASVMAPQVLASIRTVFTPEQQVKIMGIYGFVFGAASIVGQLGGGALISYGPFGLGWQAIFFVNVPVGVLALLGAWRFIPENVPSRVASLDLRGVALLSLFLALVVYPLTHGRESGWSPWLFFSLAASLPVFAIFLWIERRLKREGRDPLVDLDLFLNPAFTAALALAFLFYCDSVFFLTYGIYLQTGLGWTPMASGIAIMPFAIGLLVGPLSSTALANRIHGHVLTVGFGLMALGFSTVAVAARLSTVPTALFYAGLVAAGIGHGIVLPSIVRIALKEADQTKSGLASGVVISTLQIGSAFGTAAISGLFFAALGKQTTPTAYALAFRSGVTVNAALLFVCILLCLWLVRYQRGRDRAQLHIGEREREGVTVASRGTLRSEPLS